MARPPAKPMPLKLSQGLPSAGAISGKVATQEQELDNDAIVKMLLGGLKEETVIQVIEGR